MLKIQWLILGTALFLTNCAVYKHLEPKEPIVNQEKGTLTLNRKADKKFEIDKDEKYFISFPAAEEENSYLVLKIGKKDKLVTYLTDTGDKKSNFGEKIKDESEESDSLSVYPLTSGKPEYFWLIDQVPEDMELNLQYRYVPQWRYKFETKHASYLETLKKNRVEPETYKGIGESVMVEKLNTSKGIDTVGAHLKALEKVYEEILAIEKVFPKSILNSKDSAYQHYLVLKKDVEDEMAFQGKFLSALKFFQKSAEVRDNPMGFVENADEFTKYFSRQPPQDANVLKVSRELLEERLKEVMGFYKQRIKGKADVSPLDPKTYRLPEFTKVVDLYGIAKIPMPDDVKGLAKFIVEFDQNAQDLAEVKKGFERMEKAVDEAKGFPAQQFYQTQADTLSKLMSKIPKQMGLPHGEYGTYPCAVAIDAAIAKLSEAVNTAVREYKEAEHIVQQVSPMIESESFSEALGILKEKQHLGFLLKRYLTLDKASINRQAEKIGEALSKYSWHQAEAGLYKLHQDNNFIDPVEAAELKKQKVSQMEDSLYIKVDKLTRINVDKFVKERWKELIHVDELYEDSVFLPAYDIKFSTGNNAALITRKEKLVEHLAKLKENEFPAKAIKLLYDEFLKRPADKGVLKARAVVSHGKHYKGNDKEIKRRIHECDPWGPKWITQPTKYRRVFALPITTKKGENTYLCRLNIRVESDAKFPVYDVNIKLPKEVASAAGTSKWYDKITLDKEPLKSEGRFTITSPTAENGYEAQITPVRMKKDKNNFLDIYFTHNSLDVKPISVMVQKPLIKKN